MYDYTDIHLALLGFGAEPVYSTISATPRAKVDEKDRLGRSALTFAAMFGNVAAVGHLLEKGADPNSEDNEKKVPLDYAMNYGNSCCVQVLLDAGANPHHIDIWGTSLLTMATMNLCEDSILDSLYTFKININARECCGGTALCILGGLKGIDENETRPIEILNWLLERGADINAEDNRGETAIFLAIQHNRHIMLETLLQRGADITKVDMNGQTLLHHATFYGDLDILHVLQAANLHTIKLNTRDQRNATVIRHASWRRFHNEQWSDQSMEDMDADPEEWYDAFKALYLGILALQWGVTVEEVTGKLCDLEEEWGQDWDEWIDCFLDYIDALNGEEKSNDKLDITNKIPGAFPDE